MRYKDAIPHHSVALPETKDVIRRFNRDTGWLAALVVGAVFSAALILGVLVQDRHPKTADFTAEAVQGRGDLSLNTNSATLLKDVGLEGKKSNDEIAPEQVSRADHASAEILTEANHVSQTEAAASTPPAVLAFTPENSFSQTPSAASTPTPVLGFAPKLNQTKAQPDASSWSPVARQDSAREKRMKMGSLRYRPSISRRSVNVKARLIALWHQSLARSERARTWTAYSNLKRGVRKKAAYTAETNH